MADVPTNPQTTAESSPKLRVAAGEPAQPQSLDYAPRRRTPNRFVALMHGWFDEYFTAERIGSFFKTLLWVVPLTLLIWIYAERQQQFTQGNVTIPFEIRSADPNKVVQVLAPSDENLMVTVRGPKAVVDRIAEQFSPLGGNGPGEIKLDASLDRQQRITAIRIGEDKRFVDAGVTVVSAEPNQISVFVDTLVEQELPVELLPEQRKRFVKQPTFTPPTVKVTAPSTAFKNEGGTAHLVAYADLGDQLSKIEATSDKPIRLDNVKLSFSVQNKHVKISPPVVSVLVEPTPPKEYTFPTVIPLVAASPALQNKYEIQLQQENLFNVTVSGPPDVIDSLHAGPNPPAPRTFIELPPGDPGDGTEVEANVKYLFPPGVTVKEGPTKVKVTLKAR